MEESLLKHWWLLVIRGLLGMLIGLALLVMPVKTLVVVTVLIGLFILIDGIIATITSLLSIKKNEKWWVMFLWGLVGMLAGFAIFSYPGITLQVLYFLFSLWMIVMGILLLVIAIIIRKESEMEWLIAANGLVALVLGFILVNNPTASITIITILMALYATFSGIAITAYGFKLHSIKSRVKKGKLTLE